MRLSSVVEGYYDIYIAKYGKTALPGQMKALSDILRCRTQDAGQVYTRCPKCQHSGWHSISCGHRNCPQCQNHEATVWIERQQEKLLPVLYYLVTFTLPYELRTLAYRNQRQVFSLFFACVSSTLKDFGLNPKQLGADIGMTMVLHTHSRDLSFHPHIHVVVPGGGVDKKRRQWKKKKGRYLFNEFALAKVFRARFLDALNVSGLSIPKGVPPQWVVNCRRVGAGISAVKYLSRYLYRGVISEKNIVSDKNGQVTFRYTESKTKETRYRTMKGEDFLALIVLHVLPKGFRRVRDYGFLHGNAKKTLFLVQLILFVITKEPEFRKRPAFICPRCKTPMDIIGFLPPG